MFSKTCEYAIRAMIYIGQQSAEGGKAGIREIARQIDAPAHFISKILQNLNRQGLVLSIKGPNGGFYIDAHHYNPTLADIVLAIDGNKLFTGCIAGLKNCSEKKPCPLHNEYKNIRKQVTNLLQQTTVCGFNRELNEGLRYLKR